MSLFLLPHQFPESVCIVGMVVVLFFQCMFGLLNPANHTRGSLKWGLVAHTVVMFSLVTVSTTMGLDLQSVTYVDNREYNSEFGSGPLVYQFVTFSDPLNAVPNAMFTLSSWLADSLLVGSVSDPTHLGV